MEIKNRVRSNLAVALINGLATILTLSVASSAHADAYLDALESEAAVASIDEQTTPAGGQSAAPGSTTTPALADAPSTPTQTEFEATLKIKKRGSFLWYSRLEKEQQELVYQDFLAGTDMEALGKKILKLFTQR